MQIRRGVIEEGPMTPIQRRIIFVLWLIMAFQAGCAFGHWL